MSRCPVCGGSAKLLDVVDFNKSCEEQRGKFVPLAGVPIYYEQCESCNFCFAGEICQWPKERFSELIYNQDYKEFDPDYLGARPLANAHAVLNGFKDATSSIRHLDYGGGDGLLSKTLTEHGWNSMTWDPFTQSSTDLRDLGCFNFITAFEVFEHVPDVHELMGHLKKLLQNPGIVIFSTLLLDGNIQGNSRLTWWYASPRNGHISLFSKRSLEILAAEYGLKFGSFSPGAHLFFTEIPAFAQHAIRI